VAVTKLLSDVSLPMRHVIAGVILLGVLGAIAGLVIGLIVHAPTAWFAVFEVGIPASVVGGILGLISGGLTMGVRAVRRSGVT
jgi:hypothetical protein